MIKFLLNHNFIRINDPMTKIIGLENIPLAQNYLILLIFNIMWLILEWKKLPIKKLPRLPMIHCHWYLYRNRFYCLYRKSVYFQLILTLSIIYLNTLYFFLNLKNSSLLYNDLSKVLTAINVSFFDDNFQLCKHMLRDVFQADDSEKEVKFRNLYS